MSIEIHPATSDRFDDLASILSPNGKPEVCWCLSYRVTSGEFNALKGDERPERMRQLTCRDTAPGVIAYVDGEVAGWCGFGPRSEMGRLVRSRTIQRIDDVPVWSVVCFLVRSPFRRRGLAGALLDAAIDYAREHGAPAIEGYPIDPEGGRVSAAFAFVGTTGLFESRGFERVEATAAKSAGLTRWIVRLEL
jgi:GNAT superfamily N-acetyltransferase